MGGLTSRSIEVLSRSSLPPEWNEIMLKTIRLWFCPSEELPSRLHFSLPDFLRSHIMISPLHANIHNEPIHVHLKENIFWHKITIWQLINTTIPETAGHNLWRSPLRPVDSQPESFLHRWISSYSSSLQKGKLQGHYTWKETHSDLNDPAPESYYKLYTINFVQTLDNESFLCHLFLWLCSISAQFDLDYLMQGNTPFPLLLSPHCFHL